MAAPNASATVPEPTRPGAVVPSAPVVLDLGSQRRKRVKQLRRGEGRLMDDINGAIEELRTAGTIGAVTQPVVIIVQQKRRKARSLFPFA